MLVFRIGKTCSKELIEKLERCVENFHGKIDWKLFRDPLSRKGNYLLTISALEVMHKECCVDQNKYNQKIYFGIDKFKKYCEDAVDDIPLLAEYIEKSI